MGLNSSGSCEWRGGGVQAPSTQDISVCLVKMHAPAALKEGSSALFSAFGITANDNCRIYQCNVWSGLSKD